MCLFDYLDSDDLEVIRQNPTIAWFIVGPATALKTRKVDLVSGAVKKGPHIFEKRQRRFYL